MTSTTPVSIRVNSNERHLLEAAAERNRTNISDFMRRKALEAAEAEMLERTNVVIPAEAWERFEAWMHSPPEELPALRKLAAMRPAWQD